MPAKYQILPFCKGRNPAPAHFGIGIPACRIMAMCWESLNGGLRTVRDHCACDRCYRKPDKITPCRAARVETQNTLSY